MSDPTRIGSSRIGPNLSELRQALGIDGARERGSGRTEPGVSGRPGNRMLSPEVPVDSLDRSAPRGTYIDILV